MSAGTLEKISGLLGSLMVSVFVLGLAQGVSAGFAGCWGGLPFWVFCLTVLPLIFYDLWDTCFRKAK